MLPPEVLALLHEEPCRCAGAKPACLYCGGTGKVLSNMTPEQKKEYEAQAHASFLARQWQGD